ncbi:MAG: ATP-dependent helicase [Burkholderiaceae bacterium]|nr:ATP-dependent helicase [Burkholderiaceae bacterium]
MPVAPLSRPLPPAAAPILDSLNAEQRAAACFGAPDASGRFRAGPLLIVAGAGTGKTATLAHRVAHLVRNGIDPMRVLLLTFSRRAAGEMTRRAERLLAQEAATNGGGGAPAALRLPWAGTFHSIGARLLREYAERIGLDRSFGILDRSDSADLVDVVRHQLGFSSLSRRFPRKETCLAIHSHKVNSGRALEDVLQQHFPWCADWCDELLRLFRGYAERKQANGVLDYDDLLLWWHAAMSDAAFAAAVGARFDHVLVDEYQDTNALQAQILLAMKPDGSGLSVVGDDAQSIYAFRAAEIGNILDFPAKFEPPAARIVLERNYRSVQPLLDAANALIEQASRRHPKTLVAQRGTGARPQLVTVLDERAQADWVVDTILRHREEGVALKRQAVLFRSAHHSAVLEVELIRRDIPFVKHGGLKFLEAAHVKDLLCVLRWAENRRNSIAAFRALQLMSGFGPANAQRCIDRVIDPCRSLHAALGSFVPPQAAREAWPDFVDLMRRLADPAASWPGQIEPLRRWYEPLLERRYDDSIVRAADLDMLQSIAARFGTRERFLTELALDPPQASGDWAGPPLRDDDYLILSTVHSAKGQEWDTVFVLDVADGNFPNEYAAGRAESIDEERRLLYVAMTRARDFLYLLEPQRYFTTQQPRFGDAYVHGARSRFLTESLLGRFDRVAPAAASCIAGHRAEAPEAAPFVDVAAKLRALW